MKISAVLSDIKDRCISGNARRRVIPIVQSESAECGLACLAMVSTFYGHAVSLVELRGKFVYSLNGSTLGGLVRTASALSLISRALRVDIDEIKELKLPCLIHLDLNHFVVLERVSKKRVVICDPAIGRISLSWAELENRFSGVALEIWPNQEFTARRRATSVRYLDFARGVRGLVPSVLKIFSLALLLECLALVSPLFFQFVIDGAIQERDLNLLFTLALAFGLILLLQTAVATIKSRAALSISMQLAIGWSSNIFNHLLSLPEAYFTKRSVGDIESRYGAWQQVQEMLTTKLVTALLDGIMAALSLCALFAYSYQMTLVAVGTLCVYIVIRAVFYAQMKRIGYSQILASARQQSLFVELVRGATIVKLNNMRAGQLSRFINATVATNNASARVQVMSINFDALHTFIFGAMRIGLLCIGAAYALSRQFTTGMLISFIAFNDQFGGRSTSLIDFIFQLRLLRIQTDRISDIVLTDSEKDLDSATKGNEIVPSVEFRDVSFRYSDQEPWIIRHCNFRIEPGEFVSITGPSGAGKSTVLKLLSGLLDPTEGTILFGGLTMGEVGKNRLRDQLASVLQDDILFAGTIAENISLFGSGEGGRSIETAAIEVGVHDDIMRMPMGYDTLVGDMGSSLSGGQKQRICLARAIYRKPSILLMDEATSHLDLERERNIFSTLRRSSMTRVIVAHRPETVAMADRHMHLNERTIQDVHVAQSSRYWLR